MSKNIGVLFGVYLLSLQIFCRTDVITFERTLFSRFTVCAYIRKYLGFKKKMSRVWAGRSLEYSGHLVLVRGHMQGDEPKVPGGVDGAQYHALMAFPLWSESTFHFVMIRLRATRFDESFFSPLSVSVLFPGFVGLCQYQSFCPLSFFLKLIHTLLELNESRHRYFRPFHPCYIWWNLFVYVSAWQGWHTDAQSTYARIH